MGERKFIYSSLAFLLCLLAYQAAPFLKRALDSAEADQTSQFHLVPILCFHNIDGTGPYSVSQERFRYYLEEIRNSGVRVIPLRSLVAQARENRLLRTPSVVITIDDDYENIARVAAPILREFHYPATFFFYIQDIGENPRYGTSWDDLRRLHAEGFDIQNHSYSHTAFHHALPEETAAMYQARVDREIVLSKQIFESKIPDLDVYAFAYPMGYYSAPLRARLMDAGYEILLTTDARPVDLSRPFDPTFHRYTIQKYFVRDPEAMFRLQLRYATRPYEADNVARTDTGDH